MNDAGNSVGVLDKPLPKGCLLALALPLGVVSVVVLAVDWYKQNHKPIDAYTRREAEHRNKQKSEAGFREFAECFSAKNSYYFNDLKEHLSMPEHLEISGIEAKPTNSLVSPVKGAISGTFYTDTIGTYYVNITFNHTSQGRWEVTETSAQWTGRRGIRDPDEKELIDTLERYLKHVRFDECN
jgi:hypothetical protein